MKTIREDLKNNTIRPVYLIYGEEAFLRRSLKNQIRQALVGEDTMNYSYFEGKDTDPAEVIGVAETLPFFAERRLLILENTGWFKKDSQKMADYLPQMPETSCIVFVEEEIDKRNRLYKRVNELGYGAECKRQGDKDLKYWIAGILKKEGISVTEATLDYFLECVGDDMNQIRTEVDKLISYLGERGVLEREDVDAVCSIQINGKIFDMTAAISRGKQKEALRLYYDLLALKEPAMRILFLIARQYNQFLQMKELSARGEDAASIAGKLKVSPYIAGKLRGQVKGFTKEHLRDCVAACVDAEEAVKTGAIAETIAVEMLIVQLSKK